MTTLFQTRSARRAVIARLAFVVLCGTLATPAHAGQLASSLLTRGHEEVDASMDVLRSRWKSVNVKKVTALGGISAKVLEVQSTDKNVFIVRRPRRSFEQGLRVNVASQRMATAMGEERLVPAAVLDTTPIQLDEHSPAGSEVLVMRHVGASYFAANRLANVLANVPEHVKIVSAVIDLLSEHQDRKSDNILVKTDGLSVKMIDPDKSFGQRHGRKYRSQFFQGGMVGYTTQQQRFEDLPTDVRHYIDELAKTPVEGISKAYGLLPEEAQVVSLQAQRIRAVGLTNAIEEYVTSLGELHAPE